MSKILCGNFFYWAKKKKITATSLLAEKKMVEFRKCKRKKILKKDA